MRRWGTTWRVDCQRCVCKCPVFECGEILSIVAMKVLVLIITIILLLVGAGFYFGGPIVGGGGGGLVLVLAFIAYMMGGLR